MSRVVRLFSLLCLALLLVMQPVSAAPPAERRVALVIGNGRYQDSPLVNPPNDARDMAAALKKLGFDVTLILDGTYQQMEAAVSKFGRSLGQGGLGLFYYAGHGVQVAGENYLVPVDAAIQTEGDVKFKCLNAGFVLAKMEDAANGLNVVILDACRNNPFARSFRSTARGLAQMEAPDGSLIAFATGPGNAAEDGSGKNGTYTKHLLQHIGTPGLPLNDMFMRVRQGVREETNRRQVPWEVSSLTGYVYLAGLANGQQVAPLGSASFALPPGPQVSNVDLSSIQGESGERVKAEAASRKQWVDWLSAMKSAVSQAQELEKRPGVSASEKAEAWLLLASQYTQKNPYSDEDETLHGLMAKQAKYWTGQIKSDVAALAKAEESRQAASLKRSDEARRLAEARSNADAVTKAPWPDPTTGMEFVWVPGGSFEMGCGSWTADCSSSEKPVRLVRISGFWLGKFEVTQGQWKKVMGSNPSESKRGDNYPVEMVSWSDAKEFIAKLNGKGGGQVSSSHGGGVGIRGTFRRQTGDVRRG